MRSYQWETCVSMSLQQYIIFGKCYSWSETLGGDKNVQLALKRWSVYLEHDHTLYIKHKHIVVLNPVAIL